METTPFCHCVIDGWADPGLLRAAAATWPRADWEHWHRYDNGKLATKDALRLPPACAEVVRQMLTSNLPERLGMVDTMPDFDLHAAGLHSMPRGSRLGVHLDASTHPQRRWERAASAVLFANEHWQPEWGGELELWNGNHSRCVTSIAPRFNRLIVFETTDTSYHGVPAALQCPEGVMRNTLAVFFWRKATTVGERTNARFVN